MWLVRTIAPVFVSASVSDSSVSLKNMYDVDNFFSFFVNLCFVIVVVLLLFVLNYVSVVWVCARVPDM